MVGSGPRAELGFRMTLCCGECSGPRNRGLEQDVALPPWLGSQKPCPRRLGGGSLTSLYKEGDNGVPPRPGSRCDGVTSLYM